ncbi:polysaccharide deacetylase family protein [Rhodopseudomonas pseudopalustris]|uniref:Chitooligosaccharide deacetylase n=1 Tax=Rhodopseudomonas pseudopalustris TaxID=1513892 RepID=A0A1H8V4U5_9BRAD|nr:polysaccharide deacetylase family protein [Rhodopseudomonas pseudopalustris]SEP10416.1 Peptidoglycan/xylan/chitin deacetylase, PgdA/CDA1 family [Rhodopseudomonas pseudopalustris]
MTVSKAAAAVVALGVFGSAAQGASCPHPGVLGTARTMVIDAAKYPRVGTKSFPQTLPLDDHEVVLTFDDGPAATTPKILNALADECVKATFFLVGRPASEMPALVGRIAAEGHTVAHHTWSHQHMTKLSHADALDEINRGIAADEDVLRGKGYAISTTKFFRFPYFESTPALLDDLESRGIVVWGADLWASDWNLMTPEVQLKLITDRLEAAGKGIILFHDPRPQTVAMMPAFLSYLRENNYRVVHVVPPPAEHPAVAGGSHATR